MLFYPDKVKTKKNWLKIRFLRYKKGTVTIAAPVSIYGKIGDIAVVVKITGKNRYSTHRILMPDGSEFVFEENKNTEPTSSDMLAQKSDQGTDISSVFDNTVPQKAQSVNTSISENSENDTKNIAPVKNSLSKQGEQSTNGTPLKDLYYGNDIAPVKDISKPNTQSTDNIAPITGEEANELQSERLNTLTDDDAPPEMETEYYNTPYTTSIDDKTLKNIGKALRETLYLTPQETKAIQEIVQEYSTSESPNKAGLFDTIKEEFGEKYSRVKDEYLATIKHTLRGTSIYVSPEIKKNITDYKYLRKDIGSKLKFSQDGLPVNTMYKALNEI